MILLLTSICISIFADYGVSQFGAPTFQEREAAQQLVEALGEHAQPALLSALASENEEVRRRCEHCLAKLENFGFTVMPRIEFFPITHNHKDFREWKYPLRICREDAYDEGRERKPRASPDWVQRRATVHLTNYLLRIKWSRKDIRSCLVEMNRREVMSKMGLSMVGIGR
jgi:hypothetical protein